MNDKNLNFKRIRKMFPQTVKKAGFEAWQTKDVQRILEVARTAHNKAIVHFLASTGCRIGAIPPLKVKHVSEMSDNCKSVLFYPGEKEEYYGFLTPEASEALDLYLDKRRQDGEYVDGNSPLFRMSYRFGQAKPQPITVSSIESLIVRLLKLTNISREKVGKRYNIQTLHGFRKRFATIIKLNKNISYSTTEALLGHKSGLEGAYYKPDFKEQLFEEFRKAIQDLTVDPAERQKIKIEKLEKEKSELEKTKLQIETQNPKIKDLALFLEKNPHMLESMEKLGEMIEKMVKHLPPPGPPDPSLRAYTNEIRI